MSTHLQRSIDRLKEELIGLSAQVEESLNRAITALEDKDADLAHRVMTEDEAIDEKEMDIEEECLKILALHQPVAIDLRFIVAALKINNDLERIGDLAQNIAKNALRIVANPAIPKPIDFREITEKVQDMVKKSLDSMINLDVDEANAILEADNEVDRLNRELYHRVQGEIKKSPEHVEVLLQYIHASKHLERIADHATNIAEDIIYLISGTIVRHGRGF